MVSSASGHSKRGWQMASQMDIARKVGVDQSVVSRVLSNQWEKYKVARETAEEILRVAEELGYKPNRAANIVFGRKTNLIGVIILSFDSPFLSIVLDEINTQAATEDLGIIVTGLSGHRDPLDALRLLQGYRPDAVIVVGTVNFSEWTEYLEQTDQKIIQIGLPSTCPKVITCSTCEQAAANMQVKYLLDLGHRNIGFVMDHSRISEARLLAVRKALQKNGLKISSDMFMSGCDASGETDPEQFETLLHAIRSRGVTAIICAGDMIAAGLSRDLILSEIRIPEEVSLSSYNDVPMAAVLNPSLTTVHLPARKLARTAMDIALGRLPEKSVEIRPSLIVRKSTGAASFMEKGNP